MSGFGSSRRVAWFHNSPAVRG